MTWEACRAAGEVELLKLRRSRVIASTSVTLLLAPSLLAAGFAAAAGRPGSDALTLKARAMLPGPGWDGYVAALGQVFATAGMLGLGIGVAWCFGREYVDRTIVSLYACTTPRSAIAASKLVLLAAWGLVIAVLLGPTAVLVGLVTGLGPPDAANVAGLGRVVVLAALTGLLALTVALFATMGRGYLAAFGGLIALIVAAQVAVLFGIGEWFPLSSPALWAAHDPDLATVSVRQLVLVPVLAGVVGWVSVVWWQRRPHV